MSIVHMRYRLGAWLLRPHITALLEQYNAVGPDDAVARERCDYIGIGLRYAVGYGTAWKRPV